MKKILPKRQPKFKTLQEELDFWASKTLEERDIFFKLWDAPNEKRREKARVEDFLKWRTSGSRT